MKKNSFNHFFLLSWILSVYIIFDTNAQIRPARIFSNGMVLQRNTEIPIWGKGKIGDSVFVSIYANQTVISDTTVTNEIGRWKLELSPIDAGGPYTMTLASKKNSITLTGIYIGDVYLASGQSNMEWALSQTDSAATEIASANDQMIREFKIPKSISNEIKDTLNGGNWLPATSGNVGNFSAVAYYFAKNLKAELNIPIGIVNSSYGGSRIEAWMSEDMLGFDESFVTLQNGIPERQPTVLFNSMINPILNYPYKGILWYQGESNGDSMDDAISYGDLFKKMITGWRTKMKQGDLPFIWVQLPNQSTENVETSPSSYDAWPQLRAGQSRALELSNTGEATTIDVGGVDIHPTYKKPVGKRLALVARNLIYGEDLVYSGPRYKSHTVLTGGKIQISFDHIEGGLVGAQDGSLKWFSIAGSNNTLLKANATISGNNVIVWNENISNPKVVRYAWEYNPVGVNFYNSERLPAVPFYLEIDNPGFQLKSFASSVETVERGSKAVLNWKVYNAYPITLNGELVDSSAAATVYPRTTTSYKLVATSRQNASIKDSLTVTINVIDPQPTISVSSIQGGVVAPNTTITLVAEAYAPGGGSITKVEFFVDNELLFTDTEAPYSVDWLPSEIKSYAITAKATDARDNSTTSTEYNISITELIEVKYEAEDAIVSVPDIDEVPTTEIQNNVNASNGKFLYVTAKWGTIDFTVDAPETANYQLTIAFYNNFGPKTQGLKVNGTAVEDVIYGNEVGAFHKYNTNISLNKGSNTISIVESWGYMTFDYISILVPKTETTVPGSTLTGINDNNSTFSALDIYPNPAHESLNVTYDLVNSALVNIEIYESNGKKVETVLNEMQPKGINHLKVNTSHLPSGVYFAKVRVGNFTSIKKIVIIK